MGRPPSSAMKGAAPLGLRLNPASRPGTLERGPWTSGKHRGRAKCAEQREWGLAKHPDQSKTVLKSRNVRRRTLKSPSCSIFDVQAPENGCRAKSGPEGPLLPFLQAVCWVPVPAVRSPSQGPAVVTDQSCCEPSPPPRRPGLRNSTSRLKTLLVGALGSQPLALPQLLENDSSIPTISGKTITVCEPAHETPPSGCVDSGAPPLQLPLPLSA